MFMFLSICEGMSCNLSIDNYLVKGGELAFLNVTWMKYCSDVFMKYGF